MLAERDYYAVLGVTPSSEDVVIQAAYKALMRKYHPDANRDRAMSKWAADFNEAFAVIGRADRRADYDAQRWQIQQRRGQDRREADPAGAQRAAGENPEEAEAGRPAPWRSWAVKGGGLLLSIAAARLVALLIASLATSSPPSTSRPSDLALTRAAAPRVTTPPPRRIAKPAKAHVPLHGAPPLATADLVRAARRIEHVFGRGGVSASVAFSRGCHVKAVSGGDWSSFDFCAAFDDAARSADVETARAAGASPSAYFLGVTSPASQVAAYAPLSRDSALLGQRLRDIRRGVARHTGGKPPAASIRPAGRAAED